MVVVWCVSAKAPVGTPNEYPIVDGMQHAKLVRTVPNGKAVRHPSFFDMGRKMGIEEADTRLRAVAGGLGHSTS